MVRASRRLPFLLCLMNMPILQIRWPRRGIMASRQDLEIDEITDWPILRQAGVCGLLKLIIQGFGYWFYLQPENEVL
ncbi:fimbrial protein, partial [Vibrio vulnificus]